MKTEALKLALEALENMANIRHCQREKGYPLSDADKRMQKAITACEAALEAKDEPVAWRDAAIRLGEELSSVGPDGYYDMDAKKWLDWAMKQNPRGEHSLPQRKPLSVEEIDGMVEITDLSGAYYYDDLLALARAIEAAHGIKGEAK